MPNPKTLNNVVQLFRDIADAHLQLKQFGYGDPAELDGLHNAQYPMLWVVPIQSEVKYNTVEHTFRFAVADLVHKDEANELEVQSDCHQILEDFVKVFRYESFDYNLVNDPVLDPFTERWNDEVSGYACDFVIEFDLDMSSCNIPITDFGLSGLTFQGSVFTGSSGVSGYSGFSGYSGIGISGYSGLNGSIGVDGASGYSGYSGTNIINDNDQPGDYTLVVSDKDKLVKMTSSSDNILVLPSDSTAPLPILSQVTIIRYGTGQTVFTPDSGVTINSSGARMKLASQYSMATAIKIGTNEWVISGDLIF